MSLHAPISNLIGTTEDKALVITDVEHYRVHEGEVFHASLVSNASNDGVLYVLNLVTPATKEVHAFIGAYGAGAGFLTIHEAPTTNATHANNGTDITSAALINRNRTIAATPASLLFYNPSFASNGTLLGRWAWGAGQLTPGHTRNDGEWILKANTRYLFTLESDAASNIMGAEIDLYEK